MKTEKNRDIFIGGSFDNVDFYFKHIVYKQRFNYALFSDFEKYTSFTRKVSCPQKHLKRYNLYFLLNGVKTEQKKIKIFSGFLIDRIHMKNGRTGN